MAKKPVIIRIIKSTVYTVLFLYITPLFAFQSAPGTRGVQLNDFQLSPYFLAAKKTGLSVRSVSAASISDRTVIRVNYPLYSDEDQLLSGDVILGVENYLGNLGHSLFYMSVDMNIPFSESLYNKKSQFNFNTGVWSLRPSIQSVFSTERFSLTGELFHQFMSRQESDFFDPLRFNMTNRKTWTTIFGLNPFEDDTFFAPDSRANDWGGFSVEVRFLAGKFVPGLQLEYSSPYSTRKSEEGMPYQGFSPMLLLKGGAGYYFNDFFYVSAELQQRLTGASGFPLTMVICSLGVVF
ncbi:MAG: hypothetical protein PF637_12120 [Spirochaetes bacterium]|jgi:hypothetical protein|nr:hypothetical protein [Spirochaetota bacterium]